MDHIISYSTLGLILASWLTRATFALTSTGTCLPGNIYNDNLTLTGSSGILKSPKLDNSYPPDLLCNWLITVPEGQIVKLTIHKLELPWSVKCSRDYLEVFDGNNSSRNKSKGRLCGDYYRHPDYFRSSGRYMVVRFRSDWLHESYYEGFNATFTAESETICPYNRLVITASSSYIKNLTSPYYPYKPDNDLDCNWLLEVDSDLSNGYIIKVTFSDFQVASHDSLKFYDGNSTATSLLGSYSGSPHDHPEVIYSSGRHLYINFLTDRSYTDKGFSLRFSAVKEEEASGICRPSNGGDRVILSLSGWSGTIFSPDYPVPYLDDIKCVWTLSVPAGNVVKLTFETFRLEMDTSECKSARKKDRVLIRDGQSSKSKQLADYCGYYERIGPSDVFSTGRYMRVIFQSISDSKQRWDGFKARFEAVDPQSAVSDELCFAGNTNNLNLKLTGSHGTLGSPQRSPPNLTCDWLITVPEEKTVRLHFNKLNIQRTDYVEIRDGKERNSDTFGRFRFAPLEDIRSSGRYMRVRFRTDSGTSSWYHGFNASFVAEDKPTEPVPEASSMEVCSPGNINNNNLKLTGSSGTLQSPNNPGDFWYPPDSSCDWLVTVPDGKIVKLDFDNFDLEPSSGSGCPADYVEVLDGPTSYSEIKGSYCGSSIPDEILSSGQHMWVRFRADSKNSHYSGFKATFTAVDKSNQSTSVIIIVVITLMSIITLGLCVACIVKRKKKPNRDAAVEMPMLAASTSPSHSVRPRETQPSPRATHLGVNRRSTDSSRPREVERSPRATRTEVVQPSPRSSRQAPSQPTPELPPLPPVGYAPVSVNTEVPPPEYPYPPESPPPYPGLEAAPQYPPPGESYPWLQSSSSNPMEPPVSSERPVEPSAPPEGL